jgi:hypothetical protein
MKRIFRIAAWIIVGSVVTGSATSAPSDPHRYPFDPICAWGRIADGRGMFVRCLTPDEAQRLVATTPTPIKNTNLSPSSSVATVPSNTPVAVVPSANPVTTEPLLAELVSVVAETGELPLAKKKLSIPLDRYVTCVQNHGGLQGATGQATIKFMVTERGRAEGAGAEKYQGITESAARCIADVVDRRPTGTPEAPIVEATATIRISRKSNR